MISLSSQCLLQQEKLLPLYLEDENKKTTTLECFLSTGRLRIADSIESACSEADIAQKQDPETLEFKTRTWSLIDKVAKPTAHLWSSTSGIPVTAQVSEMADCT